MVTDAKRLLEASYRFGGLKMLVLAGFGIIVAGLLILAKKAEGGVSDLTSIPIVQRGDDLDTLIAEAARKYSVPAALIKAIAMTESSLNPNAVNPSDPSYGLCQIMPILAEDYGIVRDWHNPTDAEIAMIKDPATNLRIAAWHLNRLMSKYTMDVSIEMYNVGESGWLQGRRNSNYVSRVKRFYNEYSIG